MRTWIIGIVVASVLGFFLSEVGIIESNTVRLAPSSLTPSVAPTNSKQPTPQVDTKILEKELGQQMAVLASHYQQNIRFPHYSTPIDSGQTDLLEPLKVIPVGLNLGTDVDSSAQLTPESFTFKHGDVIKVSLSSSGRIQPTQVSIELVENNKTLSRFSVTEQDGVYLGTLDSKDKGWPVDVHIKASFYFGEHGRLALLSPIKFSPDNGTILSASTAYVDGVNLSIPVQLNIKEPGRYRLSANFFDKNHNPIAHLSAKQNLNKGNNTWILQVHSEVLRAANNPGPYILDTWTLTKLPERPGIRTSFGDSRISEVAVEGFALSLYDTTPWSDPQDKARLEFLQKLQ